MIVDMAKVHISEAKSIADPKELVLNQNRREAIRRLHELRRPLPPDFTFDREEVHARGGLLTDPAHINCQAI
jgi:hypothetical protein